MWEPHVLRRSWALRTECCVAVPHILRNIVQHRAKRGEKNLEQNVSKYEISRLVEFESEDIVIERMNKFGLKHPNAMAYLKTLPHPDGYITRKLCHNQQRLAGAKTTLEK